MGTPAEAGPLSDLTPQEAAHAASILDEAPELRAIPPARVTRILVCVPVRKPPQVLAAFLQTLTRQHLRVPSQVDYLFAPNFSPDEPHSEASQALLYGVENATVWPNEAPQQIDYADGAETRQWSKPAFERLAALKNRMLRHAVAERYDFVWLVDADVLCDSGTLQSLLDSADHETWVNNETVVPPIVAGVYWTRWQNPQPGSTDVVHAGPQVWLTGSYGLAGRGWTEADFRRALYERKRVRVWGLGACTLVPRHALEKGVSFATYGGLPPGPMSEGEDRHFCAWATRKHVPLIADAWPDIYHAYHPSEYDTLDAQVARLARTPIAPQRGDLVSAKIQILEPTVDPLGRLMRTNARWVRGRLGTLPVLPQIEQALATLPVGESRLLKLHFPAWWPNQFVRLKSLITRVTLFDAKPFRLPPVVDSELLVDDRSGRLLDTTQHTEAQIKDLVGDD